MSTTANHEPRPTTGSGGAILLNYRISFWRAIQEVLVFAGLGPSFLTVWLGNFMRISKHGGRDYVPQRDIPDLAGKVILITGGNAGLGLETVTQLVRHNPERIYLCARSEGRAQAAIATVVAAYPEAKGRIKHIPLDLSSFTSIKAAAKRFAALSDRLDMLLLNAGIMGIPYGLTAEGYEIQLGTNYIGHALLTKLLMPILERTAATGADVRVVSVSSFGHRMAPSGKGIIFDQSELEHVPSPVRYGVSKLANILFTAELARRHPSITAVSVHPGLTITDLYSPIRDSNSVWQFFIGLCNSILGRLVITVDVPTGAKNQLWAATAPKAELKNGKYYLPVGWKYGASKRAKDKALAKKLWKWTEEQFAKHGV